MSKQRKETIEGIINEAISDYISVYRKPKRSQEYAILIKQELVGRIEKLPWRKLEKDILVKKADIIRIVENL